MEIKLDDAAIRNAVSEAVFASIDQQKRDVLIQSAIQHLMTKPPSNGYGKPTSPLQDAFNFAIQNMARETATDMLTKDDTVREKLRGLIADAVAHLTETNRAATVESIANGIAAKLLERTY